MSRPDTNPAVEFLNVPTPSQWVEAALDHLPQLLIDHANCEKKAASTAISLTFKYVDRTRLLHTMSRLAREELRHFEQVMDVMAQQGIEYVHISPARYAQQLHKLVRKAEPNRLVDLLVLGAVVEARSCERFVKLIPVLPENIASLYKQLVHSEARHFEDYLSLANEVSVEPGEVSTRVEKFLALDAELVTGKDAEFRFHSGVPS